MIALTPARTAPAGDKASSLPGPTTNACTTCAPLGASLVIRGIRGGMPLLHGGQGCATYIRRYLISHFREPMDIASSSFTEASTIFGGAANLDAGLDNLMARYRPELIGVATTCLSETMGEDVAGFLRRWRQERAGRTLPVLIHVATPSYRSVHAQGFHATVAAVVDQLAQGGGRLPGVNLLPGMVSPADLRHLRELCGLCGVPVTLLPDYSETLDGPSLAHYAPIPAGGTSLDDIAGMGRNARTITLGATADDGAARTLEERFHIPAQRLGLPIGVRACDAFLEALAPGGSPAAIGLERGRLLDAYVDGHKYLFGRRVAVVGDEDLVVALCGFLAETGVRPVLAASGGRSGRMAAALQAADGSLADCAVMADADHHAITTRIAELKPDLVLGPSKCYRTCRDQGIPLLRVGFPIHDRIGAGRVLHLGYRGTLRLFDEIVNAVLGIEQERSPVGFSYM